MVTFNAAGKAPGVYMQEIEVPGPIAGVSTGVAAIIGPAKSGPLNTPTFVTNWTQFTEVFGGYIDAPVVYAPMAVRGFFENGGAVCCFVRAGVARQSAFAVVDRSDERHPVFTIKAKEEGKQGDKIKVAIKEGSLCQTTARKCSANLEQLSEDRMTLRVGSADDASLFVPGDLITVTQGGRTEEGEVAMISAMRKEIILKAGLVKAFSMDEPEQVT
ncbi:MAG: hypothetical protein FWH49_09035, partial [Clostridiales bacterium]|nr:hypothetical protein [Clostridiales bacterium]